MDDRCEHCDHGWHGASLCAEKCRVEVIGVPMLAFSASGAGPYEAWAFGAAPYGSNVTTRQLDGACACRGSR